MLKLFFKVAWTPFSIYPFSKHPISSKEKNGGYIKHRPGGILANIGEGKEDEIVSPVSKLKSIIGSNNTSNIQQPTFVYSPQVTIMGNASKDDINEALSMSQSEFNRMAENFFKNKQRLSFD